MDTLAGLMMLVGILAVSVVDEQEMEQLVVPEHR
jgi:hypothetical protein